jgi:hypothetical protein
MVVPHNKEDQAMQSMHLMQGLDQRPRTYIQGKQMEDLNGQLRWA